MECPRDDVLERYVAGDATDADAAAVDTHLETCDLCRSWLDSASADESFLDELGSALGDEPATAHGGDGSPAALGRYRVVRRIGSGGMGIVYEAEQKSPKRRVALKVMNEGAWSPNARDRFAREVELLGRLDHPGIAGILEAGTFEAPGGEQPFFAMELVRGRPLREAAAAMDVGGRVALVAAVCDAVQHAHQHGIVHRDLKPSNVLVTDEGHPKVLDFGVARASDGDLRTLTRSQGQLVGTLAYMSPEQVTGSRDEVDTRADVYALGVILYQLLAERHPLDLKGRNEYDAIRVVVDVAPTPLGAVDRSLKGDLETIAATAMAKDKERRYSSAAALADDLRRFLRHEPISARPLGAVYVASRFARRNPALVVLSLSVVVALVAGVVISMVLLVQARDAETQAKKDKEAARLEADDAIAARDWMQEILVMARPGEGGQDKSLKEVVLESAERVDVDLKEHPKVQAAMNHTLGRVFLSWNELEDAGEHLDTALRLYKEAFGAEHRQVAYVHCSLSQLALRRGNYDIAEEHARAALSLRHLMTRKKDLIHVATAAGGLANAHYAQGNPADALHFAKQAVAVFRERDGGGGADTAISLSTLALIYDALGEQEKEVACLNEALPMIKEALGPRNLHVAGVLTKLANAASDTEDYEKAEKLFLEGIEIQKEALGADSPEMAIDLKDLGNLYWKRDDKDRGIATTKEAGRIIEAALGDDHPRYVQVMNQLGWMQRDAGLFDAAVKTLQASITAGKKRAGADHFLTLLATYHLGRTRYEQDEKEKALALLREYVTRQKPAPWLMQSLAYSDFLIGRILVDLQRPADALSHLEKSYDAYRTAKGDADSATQKVISALVEALTAVGRVEDAAGFRKKLETMKSPDGQSP